MRGTKVVSVTAYIQFLAPERKASSSTQNQALNALVFLLRHALDHKEFTLGKHRLVPLPKTLEPRLQSNLATLREKSRQDLAAGVGETHRPESLARKYPNAPREWPWQFIFAAAKLSSHPRTGHYARYHLHENSLQRQFADAVRKSTMAKRASCHTLRHSFAPTSSEPAPRSVPSSPSSAIHRFRQP